MLQKAAVWTVKSYIISTLIGVPIGQSDDVVGMTERRRTKDKQSPAEGNETQFVLSHLPMIAKNIERLQKTNLRFLIKSIK